MALRTAESRTFDNGDGSFTTKLYSESIYYQPPESSAWRTIDVGIEPVAGQDVLALSDGAPVSVGLRASGDLEGYLRVANADYAVSFALLGAVGPDGGLVSPKAGKSPVVSDRVATYTDVLPDVDLQLVSGVDGVKSFVILRSAAAASSLAFAIDAPGITMTNAEDGSVGLLDAEGIVVGRMPTPYAVDSADEANGGGRFSDSVSLTSTDVAGTAAVVLTVDPVWLATATFPGYVDPSITFSTTSESFDAFVSQAYPTMNFANYVRPDSPFYHEHWLGKDPSNSSNVNDVFLKFDLSPINDVYVDSATLEVYPYHQYYNAPTATDTWLNVVNGSWSEGGITWNNKPSSTWKTTEGLVEGQTGSFNVKSTVQDWVDGSLANNGVRLHESGENETFWKRLISSEEGGSNKPALIVTYHRPTATPASQGWKNGRSLTWTFSDPNGHAQSHRQVQVSTSSTFSSILSDSGVDATASGSWSIPAGVTLTSGTEYYWRVKVKDGKRWSVWADAKFIWDTSAPTGTIAIWQIDQTTGAMTLANSFTYSTWGSPATAVSPGFTDLGFRYLYAGAYGVSWEQQSGLLLMGSRHYSPMIGRFLQPDPAVFEDNLYAYVHNNPLSRVDPSGRYDEFTQPVGWGGGGAGACKCLSTVSNYIRLKFHYAGKELWAQKGTVIAGPGSGTTLRIAPDLAATYGGRPGDWVKRTSSTWYERTTLYQVEAHWYENRFTHQRVGGKFKYVRSRFQETW